MLICLDYDGTYTNDPVMWDEFIALTQRCGHEIIMCTMRYEDTEGDALKQTLEGKISRIYFSGRRAKKPWLANLGIEPDVWIDDSPEWLLHNAL